MQQADELADLKIRKPRIENNYLRKQAFDLDDRLGRACGLPHRPALLLERNTDPRPGGLIARADQNGARCGCSRNSPSLSKRTLTLMHQDVASAGARDLARMSYGKRMQVSPSTQVLHSRRRRSS